MIWKILIAFDSPIRDSGVQTNEIFRFIIIIMYEYKDRSIGWLPVWAEHHVPTFSDPLTFRADCSLLVPITNVSILSWMTIIKLNN